MLRRGHELGRGHSVIKVLHISKPISVFAEAMSEAPAAHVNGDYAWLDNQSDKMRNSTRPQKPIKFTVCQECDLLN